MNLAQPTASWKIPANPSRAVLLEWVRSNAPDLRIVHMTLDDGRRACGAKFTFLGEEIQVEAVESDELKDPDDAIVRRVAWVIYRRMGITMPVDDAKRAQMVQTILNARLSGDNALADRVTQELAMANEGYAPVGFARLPAKWER